MTDRLPGDADRRELPHFGYEPSFERGTGRFASFAVRWIIGWRHWQRISPRARTPLRATVFYALLAELILLAFSASQDALFTLFSAATLLPALIYAATVALFIVKRRSLPENGKFELGRGEKPVVATSVVWLLFELTLFRDSSFKDVWIYVVVMIVVGGGYLGFLLRTRGASGLAMPDLASIDAELDRAAEAS